MHFLHRKFYVGLPLPDQPAPSAGRPASTRRGACGCWCWTTFSSSTRSFSGPPSDRFRPHLSFSGPPSDRFRPHATGLGEREMRKLSGTMRKLSGTMRTLLSTVAATGGRDRACAPAAESASRRGAALNVRRGARGARGTGRGGGRGAAAALRRPRRGLCLHGFCARSPRPAPRARRGGRTNTVFGRLPSVPCPPRPLRDGLPGEACWSGAALRDSTLRGMTVVDVGRRS